MALSVMVTCIQICRNCRGYQTQSFRVKMHRAGATTGLDPRMQSGRTLVRSLHASGSCRTTSRFGIFLPFSFLCLRYIYLQFADDSEQERSGISPPSQRRGRSKERSMNLEAGLKRGRGEQVTNALTSRFEVGVLRCVQDNCCRKSNSTLSACSAN